MDYLNIIQRLRPDVTWKNNTVDAFDLETISITYQSDTPIPTQEECDAEWVKIQKEIIIDNYESMLDSYIDSIAQKKGYDSRITASIRASYDGRWKEEGTAFAEWMDTCYAYVYDELTKILSGEREQPTIEELIAELPEMVWP